LSDYAINGIQVENEGLIKRASFAVDCSLLAIQKAVENKSELLIVHHGIFWGKPVPVISNQRYRIKMLLENNIGLIAYHLPLDCHPVYGNNIQILNKIGITKNSSFGFYKGTQIGFMGEQDNPVSIEYILSRLGIVIDEKKVRYLNFGKNEIRSIAVVSGGGGSCFEEALSKKADLFITGDAEHEMYHSAKENSINVLFAGHYFTETFGVTALKDLIHKEFGIDTVFTEIPTGL
jgi:dinuclear metal center YbgI/SA1388 family protein